MWRTGIGFGQQAAETRRGPSAPVPVVAALSTDIVPVELTVRSSPALTPERVVAVPASTTMSSPAPLQVTVVATPLRPATIVAAPLSLSVASQPAPGKTRPSDRKPLPHTGRPSGRERRCQ